MIKEGATLGLRLREQGSKGGLRREKQEQGIVALTREATREPQLTQGGPSPFCVSVYLKYTCKTWY